MKLKKINNVQLGISYSLYKGIKKWNHLISVFHNCRYSSHNFFIKSNSTHYTR